MLLISSGSRSQPLDASLKALVEDIAAGPLHGSHAFPTSLTSAERAQVHELSESLMLDHFSQVTRIQKARTFVLMSLQ
jgi:hypothetical protein